MSLLDDLLQPFLDKRITKSIQTGELFTKLKEIEQTPPIYPAPRSLFFDPLSLVSQFSYKERYTPLTYEVLYQMAARTEVIAAIINTRLAQIGSFGQPARWKNKSGLGYQVRFKDPKKKPNRAEEERLHEIEDIIYHCGTTNIYRSGEKRPNFGELLRKFVRDSLTYDQACHPAKTLVELFNGDCKFIEDVLVGDEVLTHKGTLRKVIDIKKRLYSGALYTFFYNNIKIQATDWHPFLVAKKQNKPNKPWKLEWIPANQIKTGYFFAYPKIKIEDDGVSQFEDKDYLFFKVEIINHEVVDNLPVYNLEVDGDHSYIANGICSHNCIELIPDRLGRPCEFWAVDAGTIRIAQPSIQNFEEAEDGEDIIKYLQIYNNTVRHTYTYREMAFCIRNSDTNIKRNGYGCCYDDKTEILTKHRGFVLFKDLLLTDSVATRNPITKKMEWQKPTAYTNESYSGRMFHFQSSSVDLMVTPNHRMLIKDGSEEKIVLAANCSKQIKIPLTAQWDNNREYTSSEIAFFEEYCELWCDFLSNNVTNNVELIPQLVKGLSASYLQRLLNNLIFNKNIEEVISINGVSQKVKNFLKVKSAQLVGDLLEVAQKAGYSAYCIGKNNGQYVVVFTKDATAIAESKEINYSGTIHCVTVPNGILYVRRNGKTAWCGNSELETLINLITSLLYAEDYNKRFFSQGQGIRGILNFKGVNIPPEQLEAFRRQWAGWASGVQNSHKMPVTSVKDGLEFINFHSTNRDMEYSAWMEFLVKMCTAVYLIDPAEVNFDYRGAGESAPLFESSPEAKLKHSRDKGLRNLLNFIEEKINFHIIHPIDNDLFFEFIGIDMKDEQERVNIRASEVQSYKKLNEVREEAGLSPLSKEDGGEMILNSVLINYMLQQEQTKQAQQQQAQGNPLAAAMGGAPEEENPEEQEESDDNGPKPLPQQPPEGDNDKATKAIIRQMFQQNQKGAGQ